MEKQFPQSPLERAKEAYLRSREEDEEAECLACGRSRCNCDRDFEDARDE